MMLAATLVLALVSLAVDRIFLGGGHTGPQQAAAAQTDRPAAKPDPVASETPSDTLIDASLGVRLERLQQENDLDPEMPRDAFCASPQWAADQAGEKPRTGPSARHVLTAVMLQDGGNAAIINDRYVRVGQEIDGWRLAEVRQRSAILEASGMSVLLKLQDGAGLAAE